MTTMEMTESTLRHAPKTETLGDAAKLFFSRASPRVLLTLGVTAWAARLWLGDFSTGDVVAAAVVIAWWPFQEWLIHVFILHFRPRKMFGVMLDPYVSRKHRQHHLDPWNLDIILIPLRSTFTTIPVLAALLYACLPTTGIALTALGVFITFSLNYEWHHYLVHTRYVPRSSWYRRIWQHHRLHHCKNEKRWFGVSMLMADRVLRTAPPPSTVETSETCRTLGYQ